MTEQQLHDFKVDFSLVIPVLEYWLVVWHEDYFLQVGDQAFQHLIGDI
jgi:hypothetical protein